MESVRSRRKATTVEVDGLGKIHAARDRTRRRTANLVTSKAEGKANRKIDEVSGTD
jgi:hypothetical protein